MSDGKEKDAAKAVTGTCPICGRPTDPRARPFCSARCADIDLHRWLGGVYRIEEEEDEMFQLPEEDEE